MGFFVFGFTSSCVNSPVILLFEGKGGASVDSNSFLLAHQIILMVSLLKSEI